MNRSFTFQNGDAVPRRPYLDIDRELETTSPPSHDAHQENRNLSTVERGLQQNLKEFRLILSPQQRTILKAATLNDLRMVLLRIEREQAGKSKSMNLPRVEAFLQRVKQLSTSSTLDTSESCTYIWASVKFVLQVCPSLLVMAKSSPALDCWVIAFTNVGATEMQNIANTLSSRPRPTFLLHSIPHSTPTSKWLIR